MTNKIFIGVMFVVKNDLQIIVETGLCCAANADEARETVKKDALRFIKENNIEVKEFYSVVQEKDIFEMEKIILRADSPKEFFANSIKEAVKESLENKPISCDSGNYIN